MRDKLREQLLARIQPALEQLAEQMVDMLLARIELHVNQLELAFDAATSAFASDLSASRVSAVEDNPRPTKRSKRAATPGQSASSAAGNVAEPHRAPTDQRSADTVVADTSAASTNLGGEVADAAAEQTPPSTDVGPASREASLSTRRSPSEPPEKRRICGCAPRGRHRKECSLPNTSTSPASDPDPALTRLSSPATSPISIAKPTTRADRFAEIEASAARREAAKRDRAERARSFVRRDGVRPTSSPSAPDKAADEMGSLEPIASFEF